MFEITAEICALERREPSRPRSTPVRGEVRRRDLVPHASQGRNQNAADGGIDVACRIAAGSVTRLCAPHGDWLSGEAAGHARAES